MAIRQRQSAIDAYYKNPKICKRCQSVIEVGERSVAETRRRTFCTHSCSAKSAIKPHPKRISIKTKCKSCGSRTSSRKPELEEYFCLACVPKALRAIKPQTITKGELFKKRNGWQSARTAIRMHAYRVFSRSGMPETCRMCRYSKHVEICHIMAVSAFPESATVDEINHKSNLCPLCPNCHWEFDNGLITKEALGARDGIEPSAESL